jgi:hypothetical protein
MLFQKLDLDFLLLLLQLVLVQEHFLLQLQLHHLLQLLIKYNKVNHQLHLNYFLLHYLVVDLLEEYYLLLLENQVN